MTADRGAPPLTIVVTVPPTQECEVCGSCGPLALQQVTDGSDATFLLCASCGTPAVKAGMARWVS